MVYGVTYEQIASHFVRDLRQRILIKKTSRDFRFSGYFSPQEHLHIPGDGNMRGYQTQHIKADQMYVMNLEFPVHVPIRIFTDFGYYGEYAFDVGARLVFGPVSFNLPFYNVSDEPWKIRWSIGFSL